MNEKRGNENRKNISLNDAADSVYDAPTKTSSFSNFSEKLLSAAYLKWFMIILLPLLILLAYPADKLDYDMWWQMAHGKYYIAHHTLKMDLSMFSWTPTDPTWIYNTCLGSIAVYLFYNFMGGFGLWLFQWLIFGGIFLSFYLFLRLINQRLDVNIIAIIATIAVACSPTFRCYKPELFSPLLFCWMVFILFYIKLNRKIFLFYLYPFIFVLWVNLHGAFVVGLVFLAMAFAGEILNRIFFSRESFTTGNLFHFGISFFLSIAATLLNPYGADYLISLFPTVMSAMGSEIYTGQYDKFIAAYTSLWPYLKGMKISFLSFHFTAWIMTLMFITFVSLSIYEFIKRRSCDFAMLIISFVLYWKGMNTSRASYFFPLAFFFFFFYLLIYRLKLRRIPAGATIFALLVFTLFFIIIPWVTIRQDVDDKWFGAGINSYAPVKEVAFLKKHHLEGPIFNDYGIGGYLVWALYPDYKVFIDPRGGLYRNQVFPDYMEFTMKRVNAEDIRLFREKYPFKIAIIHYRQMNLIFDFLKAGDEWRLLYFENVAAVLIHKSLLPQIKSEAVNADISVTRFKDVKDPEVLIHVFDFYINMDYKAGRYIYDVFKKNVSDYYRIKKTYLEVMDNKIRVKEQESTNTK
jgi:hypothetical protein